MDSAVWFEVLRPALADKQGWALFISTPDKPAGFSTCGTLRRRRKPPTGLDGASPQSKAGTFHRKKSRLRAPNSTQEPSVKSLKPALRTYPA